MGNPLKKRRLIAGKIIVLNARKMVNEKSESGKIMGFCHQISRFSAGDNSMAMQQESIDWRYLPFFLGRKIRLMSGNIPIKFGNMVHLHFRILE